MDGVRTVAISSVLKLQGKVFAVYCQNYSQCECDI